MDRNAKRLADQATRKPLESAKKPATDPALKATDESEALLN
jgi:hypothetical protein